MELRVAQNGSGGTEGIDVFHARAGRPLLQPRRQPHRQRHRDDRLSHDDEEAGFTLELLIDPHGDVVVNALLLQPTATGLEHARDGRGIVNHTSGLLGWVT